MRVIGLDYGEKRIGVAVSDPLGILAQGIAVIAAGEQEIVELKEIIEQYQPIAEIVVGLPKTLKGEIGPQAEKVLRFVDQLKREFNLAVTTWDERLTTAQAGRVLIEAGLSRQKRKKIIDKSAASLILQSYLDCKRK